MQAREQCQSIGLNSNRNLASARSATSSGLGTQNLTGPSLLKSSEPAASPATRTSNVFCAKPAAQLTHPGIVPLYETGTTENDVCYLVTEFVKGETLEARQEEQPFAWDEIAMATPELAEALDYSHGQGVVHRDIKPDNIIVGDSGEVTVLDFGLAKLATSPFESTNPDDVKTQAIGETVEGRILGTVHYMSPEQAQGQEISASTDVFSLGVVLYEMSTGTSPFDSLLIA